MKDTASQVETVASNTTDLEADAVKEGNEMADTNEAEHSASDVENTITESDDAATTPVTSTVGASSKVTAETTASAKPDVSDISEKKDVKVLDLNKLYEEMSVEELQAAILEKLAKNGPVTDQMRKDVAENVYHNSLLNWVKSFR